MIDVNGNKYKVVYIDTNVLSDFCKHQSFRSKYIELYPPNEYILSYSMFSLFEISRSRSLYKLYKDLFWIFPSMILKTNEPLIEEEKLNYHNPQTISPALLSPLWIEIDGKKFNKETLHRLLEYDIIKSQYIRWELTIDEIFHGILSLKQNFPPNADGKYTKKKVIEFVEKAVKSQVTLRFPNFIKTENISPIKFPSLKIMAYMIFFKFYSDERKPLRSDLMDIIISSTVPYVDVFVSEGNIIESLRKVSRFDDFINGIKLISIKEINSGSA